MIQIVQCFTGFGESLIAAEVENGTLRVTDVARTARQLSAMLNGYADLLTPLCWR
jgi:hypothetical protein